MTLVMTPSELAADALVRDYLNGRFLPKILHGAVVWAAERRLSSGKVPVLDETLRHDIDNQACAPPEHFKAPIRRSDRLPVCALLQATA